MRVNGWSEHDVEAVLAAPIRVGVAKDGKPTLTGLVRGEQVRVVLALDEPDLVVTIHPRRK